MIRPLALAAALAITPALSIAPTVSVAAEVTSETLAVDIIHVPSQHSFDAMWDRVRDAVRDSRLNMLYRASASKGAKGRGIDIPGNAVFGVYANDFAVRMLAGSVDAGINAPLILYLTENTDGTTTLRYRKPSDIFGGYGSADLEAMGEELDGVLAGIAKAATE